MTSRLTKATIIFACQIGITLLLLSQIAIMWTGDGLLWIVNRLGRFGSRIADLTLALTRVVERKIKPEKSQ